MKPEFSHMKRGLLFYMTTRKNVRVLTFGLAGKGGLQYTTSEDRICPDKIRLDFLPTKFLPQPSNGNQALHTKNARTPRRLLITTEDL
jgi:hypothetical protein